MVTSRARRPAAPEACGPGSARERPQRAGSTGASALTHTESGPARAAPGPPPGPRGAPPQPEPEPERAPGGTAHLGPAAAAAAVAPPLPVSGGRAAESGAPAGRRSRAAPWWTARETPRGRSGSGWGRPAAVLGGDPGGSRGDAHGESHGDIPAERHPWGVTRQETSGETLGKMLTGGHPHGESWGRLPGRAMERYPQGDAHGETPGETQGREPQGDPHGESHRGTLTGRDPRGDPPGETPRAAHGETHGEIHRERATGRATGRDPQGETHGKRPLRTPPGRHARGDPWGESHGEILAGARRETHGEIPRERATGRSTGRNPQGPADTPQLPHRDICPRPHKSPSPAPRTPLSHPMDTKGQQTGERRAQRQPLARSNQSHLY